MGNDMSLKYSFEQRRAKKKTKGQLSDAHITKSDTQSTRSENGFHSQEESESLSESSNRSESRSVLSSSSEISTGFDGSRYDRRQSSQSYKERRTEMKILQFKRKLSLRYTKSEPKTRQEIDMYARSSSDYDIEKIQASRLDYLTKVRMNDKRKLVAMALLTESELLNNYNIQLGKPLHVKLRPSFKVPEHKDYTTTYVVTVWLKEVSKKKLATYGHLYEADISFSEAKISKNSGEINKKVMLAHTWIGKSNIVTLTEKTLTVRGNFTNSESGTLDYLVFELTLTPPIKSAIGKELCHIAHDVSRMHMRNRGGNIDDGDMNGWFVFRDNRVKSIDMDFLWKASVSLDNPDKLNETLHS